MAADHDELIDLLKTPIETRTTSTSDAGGSNTQRDQSDAFDPKLIASWNPSRRDYPNVLFITFGGLALVCVLVVNLRERPGGIPIATVVIYTLLVPYILSNRFLSFVPWALLKQFRRRFLLIHCLALAVVYGLTTLAFSARANLPVWFTSSGRRPSFFYYCLGGFLLALAFWECSWISKHKDVDTS